MVSSEKYVFVLLGQEIKGVRWRNPDGSLGGWVASNAEIHPTAFIEFDAIVEPGANIGPNVRVLNGAVISAGCHYMA